MIYRYHVTCQELELNAYKTRGKLEFQFTSTAQTCHLGVSLVNPERKRKRMKMLHNLKASHTRLVIFDPVLISGEYSIQRENSFPAKPNCRMEKAGKKERGACLLLEIVSRFSNTI